MLKFGEHGRSTKEKLQKPNNILKKISFRDWGCTKDTLSDLQSYRLKLPKIRCSHLGFHNQQFKLKLQENIAFGTITGCVKMSDINDLHNEGELLPAIAHTEMLAD